LFSNNLSLSSSLNVRDQVSHPYRSTGKIIVLYIPIFTFFLQIQHKVTDLKSINSLNDGTSQHVWALLSKKILPEHAQVYEWPMDTGSMLNTEVSNPLTTP
jgi:hypothetical protein